MLPALLWKPHRVGLVEADHARKIKPWISRLEAAREGLREAIGAGDRKATVRQLEDVWFWVGRLTADLLAVEDPKYDNLRLEAVQAIVEAQRDVATARTLLAQRDVATARTLLAR